MVRDAEARGGGPLRRGNPVPPETPEIVAHVPLTPQGSVPPAAPPRPAEAAASPDADEDFPEMTVPRIPRRQTPDTPVARPTPAPAPATRAEAAAAAASTPETLPGPGPASAPAPAPTPTSVTPQPPITAVPTVPAAVPPVGPAPPAAASVPPAPSLPAAPATPSRPAGASLPTASVVPAAPALPTAPAGPASTAVSAAPALSASDPVFSSSSRRQQREQGIERRSFLQEERREEPARRGGRGILNRVGFSIGPNARERAIRDDEHEVSRHWPGPRTVAVVNGKGGAGKTPATVLLAAVFAQYGGAGVLAWDNNQTRGTLGWRTEAGAHDRTLLELLPQTQRLLGAQGQSADLAHFVHHQPQEKYDVLRSKPIRLAHENRLSPSDVDSIHAVAAKFYRLIIIDSGNDESDPMWLRMIDLADQIVVATTTRDDHAEAGALLLEALEDRDERSARLARESVVVVSQADPKASTADVAEVVAGYQPLAREVVGIPFDREMVDGHLRLRALGAPTQQAWLSAAAAVARGF